MDFGSFSQLEADPYIFFLVEYSLCFFRLIIKIDKLTAKMTVVRIRAEGIRVFSILLEGMGGFLEVTGEIMLPSSK